MAKSTTQKKSVKKTPVANSSNVNESVSSTTNVEAVEQNEPPVAQVDNNVSDSGSASGEDSDKTTSKSETTDSPSVVFNTKLGAYIAEVQRVQKELKELDKSGRTLLKEYNVVVKQMSRKTKSARSSERAQSGFAMPSLLSDELYEFLGIEKGTKVFRKDVTRQINSYITDNNLRDPDDLRQIKPNAILHKIFRSTDQDEITYFKMQRFLKHHYIKEAHKTPNPTNLNIADAVSTEAVVA